jgi:hypothetical protein
VRFQIPIFLSIALTLISCESSVVVKTTFVLEAAGGTYVQQIGAGAPEVTLGTATVVSLRNGDGSLLSSDAQVAIIGPKTWNKDQPVRFTYPAKGYWTIAPRVNSKPVAGEFTVMTNIGGEILEKKFILSDKRDPLPITAISAKLDGTAPNQTVTASWEPVKNAVGYYARVWDATKGLAVSDDLYSLEPKAVITVDILRNVARHLCVKENWLILGQGEMLEAFIDVSKPTTDVAQAA